MHKGIVIKFNTNQRYATNAWTTSVLREIASRVDVPLQVKFVFLKTICQNLDICWRKLHYSL